MKKLLILALSVCSLGLTQAQGLKTPGKSPIAKNTQEIGLSEISVEYSRPSARGRVVFGDVVPMNEIWRVGANASTKMTFGEDVKVAGKELKAGTYSVYIIPTEKTWTIIFNTNLTLWGSDGYNAEEDAIRVDVPVKTGAMMETFTIEFSDLNMTSLNIDFAWEKTRVSLPITIDVDAKIMADIAKTVEKDNRPYYQAAAYYYDNKKDMKKALDWANKAVEANPKAYWVLLLKSKIELELKDFKGATATAEKVKAMATEAGNNTYVKNAEEVISNAKKGK